MVSKFLQMQMDYIYFFYGLAFIFLAATTWALSYRKDRQLPWEWLSLFGLVHGINEWLDMLALSLEDTPSFEVLRLIVMISSFLFLLEFGRAASNELNKKRTGRWIFIPLLVLTCLGSMAGISGLNSAARYALALPGAVWTCMTLWRFRQIAHPKSRSLFIAVFSIGFYGLATSVVVPETSFFPASFLNYGSFFAFTGIPIQLLRGVLVCMSAAAFWQYYCSYRKTAFKTVISSKELRNEFWLTATIVIVLAVGWMMTWSFGEHGRHEDEERYRSDLKLAQRMLEDSVQNASELAKTLASSSDLITMGRQGQKGLAAVNSTLDRYARVIPGSICYVLDMDGTTIASSNRNTAESFVGHSYDVRPYFKDALEGVQGSYVAVGLTSITPGYYTSYPIRSPSGEIAGVAVVKLNLDKLYIAPIGNNLGFLVNSSGLILASTKPGYFLRTLRPITEDIRRRFAESKQFPTIVDLPVLPSDAVPGTLFKLHGEIFQIFEQATSVEDLSFVLLGPMSSWKMMRLASIFITLLVAMLLITFFVIQQRNSESSARIAASEKLYRTLVDGSPNWVGLFDHEGRCISINVNGLKAMGRKEAEVQGRAFSEIWSKETEPTLDDSVRQVLRGERLSFEMDQPRPIGSSTTWYVVLNPVFEQDGSVRSFVGIANDISLRKQAEEEKSKLETVNRQLQKSESLSRMAGAIAHHFNNQLGAVMGNLEMAIDDMSGNSETGRILAAAMQASRKAVEISSLMLTYLGQTLGKHVPVDLSKTCSQNLSLLQAAVPKNITFNVDLPVPGPIICADTNQIQKVMTNLVTNAWEAVEKNQGSIGLTVKSASSADISAVNHFPIDWQSQNSHYACLEVTDEGCGIAVADIEKLFDPFFSSKFTGRGLGLSIVQGIVKAHNGVVTVHSEMGIGSTFRVFFPLSDEEVPEQPNKVGHSSLTESGDTVLLVEDEEVMRNMAKSLLTRLGFKVLLAVDGYEAVEVFRQHMNQISVVLCDLTMPRMDGWKTLSALRQMHSTIPVVLASGHDESVVITSDYSKYPHHVFLQKPYQKVELMNALAKAMAAERFHSGDDIEVGHQ